MKSFMRPMKAFTSHKTIHKVLHEADEGLKETKCQ
jgi:hypothetical protein